MKMKIIEYSKRVKLNEMNLIRGGAQNGTTATLTDCNDYDGTCIIKDTNCNDHDGSCYQDSGTCNDHE